MSQHRSDLIRDSKLETAFADGDTVHSFRSSNSSAGQRRRRTQERWTRESQLGSGSFGTVWLEKCVEGQKLGQLRAVKEILKPEGTRTIDYERELEAIAKFSHEKVRLYTPGHGNPVQRQQLTRAQYVHCFVKSYGWFETASTVFIAMEYLSLGDLRKYMETSFPELEVVHMVFQISEGLEFMHLNGFAHRDLKPPVSFH
jgi:serine/threonine protein kinase